MQEKIDQTTTNPAELDQSNTFATELLDPSVEAVAFFSRRTLDSQPVVATKVGAPTSAVVGRPKAERADGPTPYFDGEDVRFAGSPVPDSSGSLDAVFELAAQQGVQLTSEGLLDENGAISTQKVAAALTSTFDKARVDFYTWSGDDGDITDAKLYASIDAAGNMTDAKVPLSEVDFGPAPEVANV